MPQIGGCPYRYGSAKGRLLLGRECEARPSLWNMRVRELDRDALLCMREAASSPPLLGFGRVSGRFRNGKWWCEMTQRDHLTSSQMCVNVQPNVC